MDAEKQKAAQRAWEMVYGPGAWSRVVEAVHRIARQAGLEAEIIDASLRGGCFRVKTASKSKASRSAKRVIAWWAMQASWGGEFEVYDPS